MYHTRLRHAFAIRSCRSNLIRVCIALYTFNSTEFENAVIVDFSDNTTIIVQHVDTPKCTIS